MAQVPHLRKLQWVKRSARVELVHAAEDALVKLAHTWRVAWWPLAPAAVCLSSANEHDLDEGDNCQGQWVVHDEPRHCEVVERAACTRANPLLLVCIDEL